MTEYSKSGIIKSLGDIRNGGKSNTRKVSVARGRAGVSPYYKGCRLEGFNGFYCN
nr:MAG TPA: hypothetical protein [Bacteriophage sp.]